MASSKYLLLYPGYSEINENSNSIYSVQGIVTSMLQNAQNDENSMDLIIVAGNGAEIKCHRNIFSAHSQTLAALVESAQPPPKSKSLIKLFRKKKPKIAKLEFPFNSEWCIRRLIDYIYGKKLDINAIPRIVTLELFKLAQEYDLQPLIESLLGIFLKQDLDWFGEEILLDLYNFVETFENFEDLRKYLLQLMFGISTMKLRSLEEFKKMCPDNKLNLVCKLLEMLRIEMGYLPSAPPMDF